MFANGILIESAIRLSFGSFQRISKVLLVVYVRLISVFISPLAKPLQPHLFRREDMIGVLAAAAFTITMSGNTTLLQWHILL